MSKIFIHTEDDERIKRIKEKCLEELHDPADGEPSSPEYDEITDKIAQAIDGYDLQLVVNGLLDIFFQVMLFELNSAEQSSKTPESISEFIDERLAGIIRAHRSFEKNYIANL